MIEKYLGSLETVERTETFVDLGIRPPKGGVEKDVRRGKDDKCIEIIMFHGDFEYNAQNNTEIDAICKILTTKLLEQIREKESGVYSIGAYPATTASRPEDTLFRFSTAATLQENRNSRKRFSAL